MAQVAAIENDKSSKSSAPAGVELNIASASASKDGAGTKDGSAPVSAEPMSAQLAASAAALAAEQAKKDKAAKEERARQMALAPPPDQTKTCALKWFQDYFETLDIITDVMYFMTEMVDPEPDFETAVWLFVIANVIRVATVKYSRYKIYKALLGGTPGAKCRDVMYAWRHVVMESFPMLVFILMIEFPKCKSATMHSFLSRPSSNTILLRTAQACDLKCQEEGGEPYQASYVCLATLFVSLVNAFVAPCYYVGRASFTCIIDQDCTVLVTCFPCVAFFICNLAAFRNDNPSMGNDINRLLGSNFV